MKKKTRPGPAWKEKQKKKKTAQHEREKKKKKKDQTDLTTYMLWVPQICVYLPKCHHNYVSITQKHLKVIFSFHNSSLKNQIIEWWKQKLKTHPNTLFNHGTHQFWVMGDGNRVIGDGNWKSKQPLKFQHDRFGSFSYNTRVNISKGDTQIIHSIFFFINYNIESENLRQNYVIGP